jgi:hypothetical protein
MIPSTEIINKCINCAICWTNPSIIAIIPCGHISGCEQCLNNPKIIQCPICRECKQGTIKIKQQVTSNLKCTICQNNETDTVIIPCGHVGCKKCLNNVQITQCPICNICKEMTMKIFQSGEPEDDIQNKSCVSNKRKSKYKNHKLPTNIPKPRWEKYNHTHNITNNQQTNECIIL